MVKRYVSGLLRAHPSLDVLIERQAAEAIWLTNGLCIEIHTCSFRSLRGYAHTFEVADRGPAQVVRDAPRAARLAAGGLERLMTGCCACSPRQWVLRHAAQD